jgi:hypothetical protein
VPINIWRAAQIRSVSISISTERFSFESDLHQT